MTHSNYELNIYSLDDKSEGKLFKQYNIDGQNTIGVNENEPFEIRFKNNTFNRVQLILSIDGINILTGSLCSTSNNEQMFVVEPYNTCQIKAWPENHNGGSCLVFSSHKKSVAVNLHGNTGSHGIIAAAIFVEDQSQWKIHSCTCNHTCTCYYFWPIMSPHYPSSRSRPYIYPTAPIMPDVIWGGVDFSSNSTVYGSNVSNNASNVSNSAGSILRTQSLEKSSAPGVGAGEYVSQAITKTAGLQKPKLDTTITVKYEWWKILRSNLYKQISAPVSNGFPGDKDRLINLKSVPKVKSTAKRRSKIRKQSAQLERFV